MTKDARWKLSIDAVNALDNYLEARQLAADLYRNRHAARDGGVRIKKARERAAQNAYSKRGSLQVALAKLAGGES